MRFGVLGPVEVRDGVRIVPVPSPKVRVLLAALLCAPRRSASVDVLTGALWGESPPRSAADNVRLYVHQLRKALNDAHRVVRDERGYSLVVHPGEVDADIFGELAAQGHDLLAAGEAVKSRITLAQALSLWRGCALAGIPMSPLIEVEAIRLEGQRVSVLVSRIEADLAVGRHVDLIAELTDLTYLHPLHERFPAQLMLALHRAGRRSEALDVYRQTRHRLVAELGIEPGRALRELEQQILRDSSRLELPMLQPVTLPSRLSFPVPAQLPADLPSFTGRGASLAALDDLRNSAQGSSSAALGLICGGAGIGKPVPGF